MKQPACIFGDNGPCLKNATWNVRRYLKNTDILGYTLNLCDEHSVTMVQYYIHDKTKFEMVPLQ